jgi:hypothetical protein
MAPFPCSFRYEICPFDRATQNPGEISLGYVNMSRLSRPHSVLAPRAVWITGLLGAFRLLEKCFHWPEL